MNEPDMITDDQLLGALTMEEKRFYRLVEDREADLDGGQTLEMACGHRINLFVPIPEHRNYTICTTCMFEVMKAERAKPPEAASAGTH